MLICAEDENFSYNTKSQYLILLTHNSVSAFRRRFLKGTSSVCYCKVCSMENQSKHPKIRYNQKNSIFMNNWMI